MSIEIQYTDDNVGIVFSAVGKVTGQQILDAQRKIYRSKGFVNLKYWIVDRSRCTEYNVNTDDVVRIAEDANEAAKTNPNLMMALVSESDLQFGMSRMYEAQIPEGGFKTKVFRDRKTAEAWIKSRLGKVCIRKDSP